MAPLNHSLGPERPGSGHGVDAVRLCRRVDPYTRCTREVIPLWNEVVGSRDPEIMLDLAQGYLTGTVGRELAWKLQNTFGGTPIDRVERARYRVGDKPRRCRTPRVYDTIETSRGKTMNRWLGLALCLGTLAFTTQADAFCGFYVAGSDAELNNNTTTVVLMREGRDTVLSMQNDYVGPPEDFALVVPVPSVLQEADVRTLEHGLFTQILRLTGPRLVEYWERDPCAPPPVPEYRMPRALRIEMALMERLPSRGRGYVRVEARFAVGEYDIEILSTDDSSALETWLRQHDYVVPRGASAALAPYVQNGMKFFVAKVAADRLEFDSGHAVLSPLRVRYQSDEFSLPVRLGLLNSNGTQDLVVITIGRNQRYEVANYGNAFMPTNLVLAPEAREHFAAVYTELLHRTFERHPSTVITEYAWPGTSCDPCPLGGALDLQSLITLGGDVLFPEPHPGTPGARGPGVRAAELVVTRMRYRYDRSSLRRDLVFRAAQPVQGGRETYTRSGLELGATQAPLNNFQARYVIRHPWTGPIECENPIREDWSGQPRPLAARADTHGEHGARGESEDSEAETSGPRHTVESLVLTPVPELRMPGRPERALEPTPALD